MRVLYGYSFRRSYIAVTVNLLTSGVLCFAVCLFHSLSAIDTVFQFKIRTMADKDSGDERPTEAAASIPAKNLRKRKAASPSSKKARPTRLPTDLGEIASMEKQISKQLNGLDIDRNLSLRVVKAALVIQKEYLERKVSQDAAVGLPAIRRQICKLFSISPTSYCAIMQSYFGNQTVYTSGKGGEGRSGNTMKKQTRIPEAKALEVKVREFVRMQRKLRKRITGRQVLDFLVSENHLEVQKTDDGQYEKRSLSTAHRQVSRWLQRRYYQRGKRTGTLVQEKSVITLRNHYLQRFFENRAKPPQIRLREVYVDEGYIHQNYHRRDDSIWDPADDQDLQFSHIPGENGRCYFLAAMQGADPRADKKNPSFLLENAGLVEGSVWVACPEISVGSPVQQNSGHHDDKVFNGLSFVHWWTENLLPNLNQPSIIYLNKNHLINIEQVPTPAKMRKPECMEYLKKKGVAFDNASTLQEFKKLVQNCIDSTDNTDIVRLAQSAGHGVVFTPPHHSDFQPMGLLSSLIIGNVGRQRTSRTTLQNVHDRLVAEFDNLLTTGHESITQMIDFCAHMADQIFEEMDDDDGNESAASNLDSDDDFDYAHNPPGILAGSKMI
jgi:hypothetical protein